MRNHFSQHTLESAPESSKPVLSEVQEKYKMIPNSAAVMAQSPVLLKLSLHGSALMEQEATLSSSEPALIYLAISAEEFKSYFRNRIRTRQRIAVHYQLSAKTLASSNSHYGAIESL